jgi:hypothetical protein
MCKTYATYRSKCLQHRSKTDVKHFVFEFNSETLATYATSGTTLATSNEILTTYP